MAILRHGCDTFEVRIKRCDDDTYFDEYEDTKIPWSGDQGQECKRYIVGEEGVQYAIEIKLHKGFNFRTFSAVQAQLIVPGHSDCICYDDIYKTQPTKGLLGCESDSTEDEMHVEPADLITVIDGTTMFVQGRTMLGSKLTFRGLSMDENLAKETDVMGVNIANFGYFTVTLAKVSYTEKWLSNNEYCKARKAVRAASHADPSNSDQPCTWDASKVDEDSFKKDGLEFGISFTGGTVHVPEVEWTVEECSYIDHDWSFHFYYRSADFLARQKIVKYPAPLDCFEWGHLAEYQQKAVLVELQEINKQHVHRDREAKAGMVLPKPASYGDGDDFLPEWRNWSRLYVKERKKIFEALKRANASWEKGEDPNAPKAKPEVIVLDDSNEEDRKPIVKRESAALRVMEDIAEVVKPREAKVKKEVLHELIDSEAPPAKRPKIYDETEKPSKFTNGRSDDEQLKQDKEEAKQLAEDIEYEERVAKMKRQQRDLKARIAAAEKKKSVKSLAEGPS